MCRWLYISQRKTLCTISAFDLLSFLIRIYCYFNLSVVINSKSEIQSTLVLTGFILDCIASIIVASAFIIMGILVLANCCLDYDTEKIQTGKFFAKIGIQPLRRMLTMRCSCPCYRTRPKLRFVNRVILVILCIILRMIAAILYSKANLQLLMILCVLFEVTLIVILAFDIYYYRVWWHYRPENDYESTPFSSKHRRYPSYHLLGKNRNPMMLDNEPCTQVPCQNRELEHILIYHHSKDQQESWPEIKDQTDIYVGFHRTNANAAVSIVHNDMQLNSTSPQMLGFGIYFARSIKHTEGKARHGRAGIGIICAKIRVGQVLEIDKAKIADICNTDIWHKKYDTVYFIQDKEECDEFFIKSADQILKWVLVIEEQCDPKVRSYDLDTEYNDTLCIYI